MANAIMTRRGGGSGKSIEKAVVELDQSSWTYDGSEHCPTVTKVTLNEQTLTEWNDYVCVRQAASQAGQYEVLVLGVLEYGGTKSVPWSIEKASNTITANPVDVSILGLVGETKQVLLNFEGDGVVTVSQSAYVTSRVDGHTLTLTSIKGGEDTLTVTVGEGTNYLSASCEVHVNVEIVSSVFENNSWETIAAVCESGRAREFWNIGDEKSFTRNGETYHFQIGGFDHDDLDPTDARYSDLAYNGGKKKAAITLIMKEVFTDEHRMHSYRTSTCSWFDSEMRVTTIPQIKSEMDLDLISVVRKVTKKTSLGYYSLEIRNTDDDLFLMSEIEVFGNRDHSLTGEGSCYEFFKSGNSTIKYNGSYPKTYWLRSPSISYQTDFLYVRSNGQCDYGIADTTEGVVLCCCI